MEASGPGQCKLLEGPAALCAQAALAVLAFASLIYKRHKEKPQRPVLVWGLDVSKQVVSMFAAHICGMLIAILAHQSSSSSSECAWYFVAYTFDTTLGLLLTIAFHKSVIRLAKCWKKRHGLPKASSGAAESWYDIVALCGNYGDPPSLYKWWLQMSEWVLCVVAARAVCGTLVILLGGVLMHISQALDSAFEGHPTLLLYFVMICCPLCMNMVQVLIQDAIIKWHKPLAQVASTASLKGAADPLLQPLPAERAVLLEGFTSSTSPTEGGGSGGSSGA